MDKCLTKYRSLCVLILLCLFNTAYSEKSYRVFYTSTENQVDFRNADSYKWVEQLESAPNLGIISNVLWVKVQLDSTHQYIVIENAHIDSLNVYFFKGDSLILQKQGGDHFPFSYRTVPFHYINFEIPSEVTRIFIRVKTEGSSATPVLLLKTTEIGYFLNQLKFNWGYFGVLILTLVINFIFGIYLKERINFYYCLYIFGLLIGFMVDYGYLFQYLYPNTPWLNKYVPIYYCSVVLSVIFTEHYLSLKDEERWMRIFFFCIYASHAIIATVTFFDYSLAIRLISLDFLAIPIIILGAAVRIYLRSKTRSTLIFILAWTFYLLFLFLYTLASLGILPYNDYWVNMVLIGSVSEVIILQFAVLFRINKLREDNVKNKLRVVDLLEEREKMLVEHNASLERTVYLRTMELKERSEEVIAQNEMLQEQQQELEEQHEKLEVQNRLIEEVNNLLLEKHRQLERQVSERTSELQSTNQELQEKNHRLEQFAYVAAHNLRGPVATLLGLSQVAKFEFEQHKKIDEVRYIDNFQKTSEKLDSVIKGLSFILDLEKNMDGLSSETDLNQLVTDVEVLLKSEIQQSRCKLSVDFTLADSVVVIPVYLNNVFYNLISNSIKYQRDGISPVIEIQTVKTNNQIVLQYSDNSLGIDLAAAGDKLFKPFKRFTEQKTGIGLGLYMIKVQVEAMGATIKLDSAPGKGVKYTLIFKA